MASDARVIQASLAEPALFSEIFDRHFSRLSRFLRRRLPLHVADDLAAETFTRAFSGRDRYDFSRQDAAPWLLGIASNLVREHYRLEGRTLAALGALAASAPSIDEIANAEERIDAAACAGTLATGLGQLRPIERDIVLLFAWEDLSYSEIAEALSLPLGSVRSSLHRARMKLRTALAQAGFAVLSEDDASVGKGG